MRRGLLTISRHVIAEHAIIIRTDAAQSALSRIPHHAVKTANRLKVGEREFAVG